MHSTVIKVENISKLYRLGGVGTGALAHDVNRWFHKVRGKEDPYQKIGESNDRSAKGSSDYVWALKDINFEVQQGEVLGIIGRNGAGKSTLLKILSKTTTPTTGKIKIKGRIASLLEVGTGFHPELSGRENIFLNGAILGMTRREIKSKFDEIVDFAGVERYIDTPVKRYSSGMYVRLAFGVAAHLESDILIVDEVLAVGDAEFQKKAIGKMKDVSAKQGRTVLFVSHNLNAASSLCDKGIVIDTGSIVKQGRIKEAIGFYQNFKDRKIDNYKIWDESEQPENLSCKILSVELINLTDKEKRITTDDSFAVKINYKSLHNDSRIGLTVIVSDLDEHIIFSSINNHESQYYGKPMPSGDYYSTCIIPRFFFNAGTYSLSIIMFGPNANQTRQIQNVFDFEILDGFIVRGDFTGDYGGFIRPLLDWDTGKSEKGQIEKNIR